MKKRFKRKLFATFLFSLATAVLAIIHGVFFDLKIEEIKRLTFEGFVVTFVLVFIGLVILEKIFTLEEDAEILTIKKRLGKLEK